MQKERIKAEYISEEYKPRIIIPDWYIFRVHAGGHRYYGLALTEEMSEPKYAPGVTSILHDTMPTPYGLTKWREQNGAMYCDWFMDSSAMYGTWLHSMYGSLMRGEEILFSVDALMLKLQMFCEAEGAEYRPIEKWTRSEGRNPQKDIYGFITWYNEHKIVPIAIEYPLFVDGDQPYAGTIDLVCEMTVPLAVSGQKKKQEQKVIAIVDFKTGYNAYESHAVQLEAYRQGWNQQNPDVQITEAFNLLSKDYNLPLGKTAQPYSMRRQTDNKARLLWPDYLEIFHKKHAPYSEQTEKFTDDKVNIQSKNIVIGADISGDEL